MPQTPVPDGLTGYKPFGGGSPGDTGATTAATGNASPAAPAVSTATPLPKVATTPGLSLGNLSAVVRANTGPTDQQAQVVKTQQQYLSNRGYYGGAIDGIAGPKTQAAQQSYQTDMAQQEDAVKVSTYLHAVQTREQLNQQNADPSVSG
jgi:hypothetical protein